MAPSPEARTVRKPFTSSASSRSSPSPTSPLGSGCARRAAPRSSAGSGGETVAILSRQRSERRPAAAWDPASRRCSRLCALRRRRAAARRRHPSLLSRARPLAAQAEGGRQWKRKRTNTRCWRWSHPPTPRVAPARSRPRSVGRRAASAKTGTRMAAACYTARPTGGFEAEGCAHVGGYRGGGDCVRAERHKKSSAGRSAWGRCGCGLGHSLCVGLTESDCRRGGGSSRYFVGGPSFDLVPALVRASCKAAAGCVVWVLGRRGRATI
mmetsp:Transcript_43473/g.141573  ORF Transcript_43473/g.141573 Transcript_43473/m.141573 type:complete len:267 (+) Transcript_43473:481-1281(+)